MRLCKKNGSMFFTFSHHAVINNTKVSLYLLFSRLNRISSLSISSYILCSIPYHPGGLRGLWYLRVVLHQGALTGSCTSRWALTTGKGKVPLSHSASCCLDDAARDVVAPLCHRDTLDSYLTCLPGPQRVFHQTAFQAVDPAEWGCSLPDTELSLTTHISLC